MFCLWLLGGSGLRSEDTEQDHNFMDYLNLSKTLPDLIRIDFLTNKVLAIDTATITALIATTTTNTFSYLRDVLPTVLVFGVIIGVLFMAIRWVWSAIRGHGTRP